MLPIKTAFAIAGSGVDKSCFKGAAAKAFSVLQKPLFSLLSRLI
jgi:hypothetical protein